MISDPRFPDVFLAMSLPSRRRHTAKPVRGCYTLAVGVTFDAAMARPAQPNSRSPKQFRCLKRDIPLARVARCRCTGVTVLDPHPSARRRRAASQYHHHPGRGGRFHRVTDRPHPNRISSRGHVPSCPNASQDAENRFWASESAHRAGWPTSYRFGAGVSLNILDPHAPARTTSQYWIHIPPIRPERESLLRTGMISLASPEAGSVLRHASGLREGALRAIAVAALVAGLHVDPPDLPLLLPALLLVLRVTCLLG